MADTPTGEDSSRIEFELESDDGFLEIDIANTHDENRILFTRGDVKAFYEKLEKATRPPDEEFIAWIGSIPCTMRNTAIPLFRESSGIGADYQVHPCYSQLPRASLQIAVPRFDVCEMDLEDGKVVTVIPFGRLFVNMAVDEPGHTNESCRVSKWTGYEVLFDTDLNLWFIFDEESLHGRWSGWFPIKCNIGYKSTVRGEGK
ncbi:hypothetical protein F5Y14DRAFT_459770 [Nemania sp. NC0429]|nr:hypothetical protein F5Y14DRAFT_459770 [Nemania sp. NC0429]